MDFTTNNIQQKLGYGARVNKFHCSFPSIGDSEEENMTYFLQSVDTPEKSIGEIVVNHQGLTYKLPGDITVSPVTLTFRVDQNMKSYNYMNLWINLIVDSLTNSRGLLSEVQKNLLLHQDGPNNEIVATWDMKGVFPTNVGPISYDADSVDTIGQFTVTFAINDFEYSSVGSV